MNTFGRISGHAGGRLLSLLALVCLLSFGVHLSHAQGSRTWAATRQVDDGGPVRIVSVYGPTTLPVGVAANYRVRLADGAARPIIFRWQMGDGTRGEGNNVAHVFERPGRYAITVTARNQKSSDSETLYVTAVERKKPAAEDLPAAPSLLDAASTREAARDARAPNAARDGLTPNTARDGLTPNGARVATTPSTSSTSSTSSASSLRPASSLRGDAPIDWKKGGYTLMAATASDHRAAEIAAEQFRGYGLRTGIYLDRGPGSPAYRVIVGQFGSAEAAVAARKVLLIEGLEGAFLVGPLPVRSGEQ